MRSFNSQEKTKKEYSDCRLRYKLAPEDDTFWDLNRKNYAKMKEALEAVGIWLNIENDELSLSILPTSYLRTRDRNAGRRTTVVLKKENNTNGSYELYKYADIVLLMQTMKDQEIADKLGMPIATYYRHKKKMKESTYFKSLDLNRLRDKEYLESISGNYCF